MAGKYTDRLWILGGTLGAAMLLMVAWLFLISPRNAERADLRDRAETTTASLVKLRSRLTELQQQNNELPRYQAELAAHEAALPSSSALPALLRQLQATGARTAVVVNAVSVGVPAPAGERIGYLPVTVTASGAPSDVDRFVTELQAVGPRAALVETASTNTDDAGGPTTLNVNFRVFYAEGAPAAPAPTPN